MKRLKLSSWGRVGRRSVSSYYNVATPEGSRARIDLLRAPSHFGHYTSRVNRPQNEDRYYAGVLHLPKGSSLTPKQQSYTASKRTVFNFSVFDGHGGIECCEFLRQHLAEYVENYDMHRTWEIPELYKRNIGGYWKNWTHEVNKFFGRLTASDDLQVRVPMAFLQADYDFMLANKTSGSTCTSVFLYPRDDTGTYWDEGQVAHLVVAHVGDTRCFIVDRYGTPKPLTTAHHPSSEVESERLSKYTAGIFMDSFGEERYGPFANTRAFGDFSGKRKGISAEPEVLECRLGSSELGSRLVREFRDEAFLVLCTDGVSDMATDQEVADVVIHTACQSGSWRGTPQDCAEEVVKYAEALGGNDNATCLIVRLSSWGQWFWHDRTGSLREDRLRDAFDSQNRRDKL
ncbi:[Pyruvate dehydrogenase [acetyl-transferring]]-phosphatase 2, mitochondrial [Trichomonascus vanleenenianus]|uniref:type 2C protein phosphatase PTC6 n=1 Tax=Trichomonascus vanleenenianus TaxID=2268995 RepID=UPI003ECB90AF